MKKTLLFLFAFGLMYTLTAQVITSDNFDSYTAGSALAQQAGAPWTTWSGTTGGAEDPLVSTTQSVSGANSVYISTTSNDLVLDLGDKTTGRYKIGFSIYVETNKVAYFNILNDFAGSSSTWAMQAYMRTNGYISVDAGAALVDSVAYTPGTWTDILFVVDVDDDFATMYVDGTELVSWVFSTGSFGQGSTQKLDAVNFYGWSDGVVNPGYYIDDVVFEQVTVPEAPMNLTATVTGNDIAVAWSAPGSGSPDSYTLLRNNEVIASGLATTTYADNGLYPSSYNYLAKAHYPASGYSHSSNDTTVTIAGAVTRDLVLFEFTTSVMCYYCPGASLGAQDLVSNGKDVAIIKYHNDWQGPDPYTIPEAEARGGTYYSSYVTGNPTAIADGTEYLVGGNHTTSLYPNYVTMYDKRICRSSLHTIDIDIVKTATDAYTATVTVVQTSGYYANNLYLRTALTESDIAYSWQGQTDLHFVCLDMYPDDGGYALDFSTTDTITQIINFTTTGSVADNCEFVAFVQYDGNKDVTQAGKVDLATIVGVEDRENVQLNIYPNPANDYVNIISDGSGYYEILNIAGQVVLSGQISAKLQTINTSDLNSGMYLIRVNNNNESSLQKLIIQ
ncbi:MAG: hypothetical protein C0592_03925 [Marinilabiliales bacterium]|nr:MAG: hypothetical protein C0592_03925 [Marinilabiliales bacterium]